MFTSTEIRGIQFEVNRKGYNVEDVRAFLNQVAYQFDKLEKEKAELEQNMLVLADKLDEYRREEEKLSAALFNAQKISENIVAEAQQKADIIVSDARIVADNVIADANAVAENTIAQSAAEAARIIDEATAEADRQTKRAENEERNYQFIRNKAIDFKSTLLELYSSHLDLLGMVDLGEKSIDVDEPDLYVETVSSEEHDAAVAEGYEEYGAIDFAEEAECAGEETAEGEPEYEEAQDFVFEPSQSDGFSTVEFPKYQEAESDQFTGSFSVAPSDANDGFDTTGFDAGEAQELFDGSELEMREEPEFYEPVAAPEMSETAPVEAAEENTVPEEGAQEPQKHYRKTRYARRSMQNGVGLGEARSKDRELKFGSDFSFDI